MFTNALRNQAFYLDLARRSKQTYFVNTGLDKLDSILRKMIEEKHPMRPDAEDTALLTRILDQLAEDNPIIVGNIKSKLEQVRAG